VDYIDATLLRLADETTRDNVFDQTSLEHIVSAGYDIDAIAIEGPFSPVFDRLELGVSYARSVVLEGNWRSPNENSRTEARFQLSGLHSAPPLTSEAYWHGGIAVRVSYSTSRIESVTIQWPRLDDIDDQIVADLGDLPGDPVALENARRTRLRTRLQATMADPVALTEIALDSLLDNVGVETVGQLLDDRIDVQPLSALNVTFSEPEFAPTSPQVLPVSAAVLIRDDTLSVSELLIESKQLLDVLYHSGLERARDPGWKIRNDFLVIWIIPETVFDDDDWPGGGPGMNATQRREARRMAAGEWLAREGIGLVTTAAP